MEWGVSRREGEREREEQIKGERWSIDEYWKRRGLRKVTIGKDISEFKG